MASTVRQESAIYLEWNVNTCPKAYKFFPGYILKTERNFVLPDCNCQIEFSIDTSPDAHACLFFKRYGSLIPELQVKVFASWNHNSERFCAISKKPISGACEEIWRHEAKNLLGASLTIEIIIHADNSERDKYLPDGSSLNSDECIRNLTEDFSDKLGLDQKHAAENKHKYPSKSHKKVIKSNDFKPMLDSDTVGYRQLIVKGQGTNIRRNRKFGKRCNMFKKSLASDIQLNKSEKYPKRRRRNRRTRTYSRADDCVRNLSKDSSELLDIDQNRAAEMKCETSSKDRKNILGDKSNDVKPMLDSGMVRDRVATGELQDTNNRPSREFKRRRNLYKKSHAPDIQLNKSEKSRKQRNLRNRRTRNKQKYNQPYQNVFHDWWGNVNPAYTDYAYYG